MERHSPQADSAGIAQGMVRLMIAVDEAYTQASRELGLTAQQAQLLCATIEPAAVGDLAEVLHCDRSNVSRLVERAADRGLVARRRGAGEDRRVTTVQLTAEGHRHVQKFIDIFNARLEPLFADWSTARQTAAVELLDDLAEALEEAQVPVGRRVR